VEQSASIDEDRYNTSNNNSYGNQRVQQLHDKSERH